MQQEKSNLKAKSNEHLQTTAGPRRPTYAMMNWRLDKDVLPRREENISVVDFLQNSEKSSCRFHHVVKARSSRQSILEISES